MIRHDNLLLDGRQYLTGDRFSRADVTVVSLLVPVARPKQMKIYHDMDVPEAFTPLSKAGWIGPL